MFRRLLAAFSILTLAVAVVAADPVKDPIKLDKDKVKSSGKSESDFQAERQAAEQQQMKQKFLEFKQQLLRLAQNFELSSKPEMKQKAVILRMALKLAGETGTDAKFNKLIELLRTPKVVDDLAKIEEAELVNQELHKDLQQLIRILMQDNRAEFLKAERLRTEKLLEQLKDVIRKQERLRAQIEQGRRDNKDIADGQKKVTGETKDLIGEGKDNKGNEGKNGEAKSHGKDNAKEGAEGRGAGKEDTPEAKGDGKNPEGKNGENKEG